MGRGDKRTKRGKIAMGSFGKKRKARRKAYMPETEALVTPIAKKTATRKSKAETE